jgi:hypothetical protein
MRVKRVAGHVLTAVLVLVTPRPGTTDEPAQADLRTIASGRGWRLVNRSAEAVEDAGKAAARLSEARGPGLAWVEGSSLDAGTIEVDLKGKDVFQRSFLGVAFHGEDDETYEAIYFRPFNFKTEDAARRHHAVQYVAHPRYTWQALRKEKPEMYESNVNPVPDPNDWFHARIVLAGRKVSVYVNDSTEPCLAVERLSDRTGGRVGLWVGEGSGGLFSRLGISPAKP